MRELALMRCSDFDLGYRLPQHMIAVGISIWTPTLWIFNIDTAGMFSRHATHTALQRHSVGVVVARFRYKYVQGGPPSGTLVASQVLGLVGDSLECCNDSCIAPSVSYVVRAVPEVVHDTRRR